MRRTLDALYLVSGAIAALFIVGIVGIVFAQVSLNLADKIVSGISGHALGLTIPSYSDFTGFFLAAASFLALAYTLRAGGHIRVTLVTGIFAKQTQSLFEGLALSIGALMTGYGAWYMSRLVLESYDFHDMTSGMFSIPLWIPQMPVAFGMIVLTIALVDELVGLLRGKAPTYDGQGEKLLSE